MACSTISARVYAQRSVRDPSIATVYRNLDVMVEENWLVAVQVPGEFPQDEISGKAHHRFWCKLFCRNGWFCLHPNIKDTV
jgi:Fe2+ or Zn2+ uptake regulation protein